jgi:DNA repair protein RecN (Recombination protein N)
MLVELEIRDFAIIEHLRLRLQPGFNVLTGETGAGKSIIVGAVGQLLGERADSETVRAGAERALIEGVFEPGSAADAIRELLEAYGVDEDPVLILGREIHAAGRSIGRVNGRTVPIRALGEIGQLLIDVHGQSENASLQREAEHLLLLDRYAGLEEERLELAERVVGLRALEEELAALRIEEAERLRQIEMLRFQATEIDAAELDAAEKQNLLAERKRLANAEKLLSLADRAYRALRGDEDEQAGGLDGLDEALVALEELAEIDDTMASAIEPLQSAVEAAADAAGQLRDYRDGLDFEPQRLGEIEDRLEVYASLERKYGAGVETVIARGEQAAERLAAFEDADQRAAAIEARLDSVRQELGRLADRLSQRRFAAGQGLATEVAAVMSELGMPGSAFEVAVERRADPSGVPIGGERFAIDARGIDRVAFRVSTNPGEPTRRLVQVASGGETARIMLALKSILTGADRIPTLIFDEIDAGIGGRIGAVVGRKLSGLAGGHQVLCVTHLPQVAAFGGCHWHVRKEVVEGRTTTAVRPLEAEERIEELTLMLGGGGEAARDNARQLIVGARHDRQTAESL